MNAGEVFGRIAAWAARHARVVLAVTALVAVAAGLAATRLTTDAGTDTLVASSSPSFQASEQVRQRFGDDPIVILAEGDLRQLVLTANLGRLLRLEGCLSGRPPKGVKPIPGPCTDLAQMKPVKLVTGPATFLNQAVIGIQKQLGSSYKAASAQAKAAGYEALRTARAQGLPPKSQQAAAQAAAQQVLGQYQQQLLKIAATYGITSLPRLDDPRFVSAIVFDLRQPSGTPKAKLSYLFPNGHSAQIIVRLRPDLSNSERHRAIGLIRSAVEDTTPRAACADAKGNPQPCFALHGGRYVISGAPVVLDGLAGTLQHALLILFCVSVAVMALTLLLVFRSRMRLLPLLIALAATGLAFGLLSLVGGTLTMASIAVLPVLIGLAVDYAIQLQARFDEARAGGASGPEAARLAAARGAPVIGAACLATGAGFLVLQLSPTPMVRSFGLLLVAGIAIAFLLAITAGLAALSLRRSGPRGRPRAGSDRLAFLGRAQERAGSGLSRAGRNALAVAITSPGRVLAVALALGLCGWIAGTRTETVSDFRELVPQNLREVRDLNELQRVTGVSGELDVSVQSSDMSDPAVWRWMANFKQRVLRDNGFDGSFPSCHKSEICPGPSVTDFAPDASTGGLTRARIRSLLAALPDYDLRGVISGDMANIAFGIRAQSLSAQQDLIDRVRSEIDPPGPGNGPPAGTTVRLAGLPVIAAASATDLSHSRYWLTLAGLVAVALALLAVYRSASRALVPLIPIVLATGWSALVLAAMGIPLNPMSAALGVLVIAIATEFSVILSARYHEERAAGNSVGEALRRAYARTGAAVLASGITAIAGFAALIPSEIRMLRDFGFVTVVDLGVALAGVMLVLPAALVWAEQGFELRGGLPLPRRLAALRPRPARR